MVVSLDHFDENSRSVLQRLREDLQSSVGGKNQATLALALGWWGTKILIWVLKRVFSHLQKIPIVVIVDQNLQSLDLINVFLHLKYQYMM